LTTSRMSIIITVSSLMKSLRPEFYSFHSNDEASSLILKKSLFFGSPKVEF
jgi:hypothetical protein